MKDEIEKFDRSTATLVLSDRCREFAVSASIIDGSDPVSALFGAAIKTIEERLGQEHVLPVAKMFLETLLDSQGQPGPN